MFRRRSGHPVWIHLSLAPPAHNAGWPETFVLAPSCAFTQYVTLRYWALSVLILPLVRDTKFRMCFWGLQLSQVQSLSSNLKGSVELQISSATNANFCQLDLKCTAVVSVTSVHVANASGYTRQLYINQDDFTVCVDSSYRQLLLKIPRSSDSCRTTLYMPRDAVTVVGHWRFSEVRALRFLSVALKVTPWVQFGHETVKESMLKPS